MDLKALCKSYEWQGMTIYMLGYRNLEVDIAINDLEDLEPHWLYVNRKTGAESATKPEALTRAEEEVEAHNAKLNLTGDMAKPVKTDWEVRNLWSVRHSTFAVALPLIMAIDFPPPDVDAPREVRVFEAFWNDTTSDFAERWQAFKRIIAVPTINALWEAYEATRDNLLSAPQALQSEAGERASEEKKDDAPEPNATS